MGGYDPVKRDSDGITVKLYKQEAEQADIDARAKRVILVNSSGTIIKSVKRDQDIAGSSGTGSNGDPNQTFTIVDLNDLEIVGVHLDGTLLNQSDYTFDNSAKTVTIILNVFDSQTINVVYYV